MASIAARRLGACSPHLCVGFSLLVLYPAPPRRRLLCLLLYTLFLRQLSHTHHDSSTFSHKHTLSRTVLVTCNLSHKAWSHIQLLVVHNPSHTHTHNLATGTHTHTHIFVAHTHTHNLSQKCFTHTICSHTTFSHTHTHNFARRGHANGTWTSPSATAATLSGAARSSPAPQVPRLPCERHA